MKKDFNKYHHQELMALREKLVYVELKLSFHAEHCPRHSKSLSQDTDRIVSLTNAMCSEIPLFVELRYFWHWYMKGKERLTSCFALQKEHNKIL